MRHGNQLLTALASLHLAVFALAVAAGAFRRHGSLTPPGPAGLADAVSEIVLHNLGSLAALVVSGLLLAGIAGIVMFAANGYVFGHALAITDAPLAWVWVYAPVEILSFALGGAASMGLGIEIVRWLRHGPPVSAPVIRRSVIAVGLAAAGLGLAAVLEGIAIQRAWGHQ
jgi:hypothetical protein